MKWAAWRDDLHPEQVRSLYIHDTAVNPGDFCRQIALELGLEPSWSRAMILREVRDGQTGVAVPVEVAEHGQQSQHLRAQGLTLVEHQQHGELTFEGTLEELTMLAQRPFIARIGGNLVIL